MLCFLRICEDKTQLCWQAEELQQLVPPGVAVVKCLNTVSAYEMENTADTAAAKMVGAFFVLLSLSH